MAGVPVRIGSRSAELPFEWNDPTTWAPALDGMGAAYICEATMVGNYWGPEAFARIRGVIGPIAVILEAGVVPLAGFLYDLQGTYRTIMIITWVGAILAIGAVLLCTPPRPVERQGVGAAPG